MTGREGEQGQREGETFKSLALSRNYCYHCVLAFHFRPWDERARLSHIRQSIGDGVELYSAIASAPFSLLQSILKASPSRPKAETLIYQCF